MVDKPYYFTNQKYIETILNIVFAGVLMWEVFTCGKMPYGRLKNTEVVERVQRGIILEKPKACAKEIYDVSIRTRFIIDKYVRLIDPFIFAIHLKQKFSIQQIMKLCLSHHPEDRPAFRILKDQLALVAQGLTD